MAVDLVSCEVKCFCSGSSVKGQKVECFIFSCYVQKHALNIFCQAFLRLYVVSARGSNGQRLKTSMKRKVKV